MRPRTRAGASSLLVMSRVRHGRALPLVFAVGVFMIFVMLAVIGQRAQASSLQGSGVAPRTSEQTAAAKAELTIAKAVVLGIVEGVTEFLPISSTGHLLITQKLMGVGTSDATKQAADDYAVIIQAGAILAVLLLYWRRFLDAAQGAIGRSETGRRLLIALVIGFLPAAVVGFLFEKTIKEHLFAPWPVVAAWVVGGVVLLVMSSKGWLHREREGSSLDLITVRQAAVIGGAQCLALWPGTSRSLVTIVAALLVGMELVAAVEFSFLLGFVTLSAATAYDVAKSGGELVETYDAVALVVGFVVAGVAAAIAIRWMVGYLQKHSLAIFGWYRLVIAGAAATLIVTGRV